MPRLDWNAAGSRFYEAGVDRGVLYVNDLGVVWNGLTSVNESSSGGEATPFYLDGVKYLNTTSAEEFEATLTAYTYPDEFGHCDGTYQPRPGLFISQQKRQSFGLSYRTKIGSDLTDDLGYKIHVVYNALASPSERQRKSIGESTDPMDFSWNLTTRPPAISGYKPMAHIAIDSRYTDPDVLVLIENTLYGTDSDAARLPAFSEFIDIFDTISSLTITDNGDGTWTATAPFDIIQMLDSTTFAITAATAIFIDEVSYNISST